MNSAYLRVSAVAKKVSGIDILLIPSGRSTKRQSNVRGCVYNILAKHFKQTREETAQAVGTDHGTISYHIIKHDKRYSSDSQYYNIYDAMVRQLFDVDKSNRYRIIENLINEL